MSTVAHRRSGEGTVIAAVLVLATGTTNTHTTTTTTITTTTKTVYSRRHRCSPRASGAAADHTGSLVRDDGGVKGNTPRGRPAEHVFDPPSVGPWRQQWGWTVDVFRFFENNRPIGPWRVTLAMFVFIPCRPANRPFANTTFCFRVA